jgi:hypothetical protein
MFITKKKHEQIVNDLLDLLTIQVQTLEMANDSLQQIADKTASGEFIKNPNFKSKTKKKENK